MSSGYGSGQRMPSQQTFEAPACVQNAMMNKEKKPFTYTPGGIDLSQIKSERMAKRLARNAQAEGATGQQQHNRPMQPQSPGSPSASANMGAAALGMPFQVLPPTPPPPQSAPGKNFNGGSAPAPPPPPPQSSSNLGTLAPPTNGNAAAGGRGSAPNSPSMARKSQTPQRFEPPPMGFRPEIKIPPNPMAALRKVPPPVEKNTFWKEEYAKERSKSPMVDAPPASNNTVDNNTTTKQDDSVNSSGSSPQTNASNGTTATNNGETNIKSSNCDNIDGPKKSLPTTSTTNNNINTLQQNQTNSNNTNNQPQQQQQRQQTNTPPQQQSPITTTKQQLPQNGNGSAQQTTQQAEQSPRPEFRSVAPPQSPAVNAYTRQTESPRTMENATPPRATDSPFKYAQQQQRAPQTISPLAQQSTPSSAGSAASVSPNSQAQAVPWRTQRSQQLPEQQPQPVAAQSQPQTLYNNIKPRSPDFTTQTSAYQGPKPTNVGSLYIAPLAPPTEPQAQHIVRQQLQQQQQQQQRDSPMRQMAPQQQNQGAPAQQQLRWMSSQPKSKEQPAWVRPEENGNVIPSSLNRQVVKSPPPPPTAMQQQPQQQQFQQPPQQLYQPLNQGNGFMPQNFGAQPIISTGLRLQINAQPNQSTHNAPKERIIPITLEATPTYTPAQPSFNNQQQYGGGSISPAPGYVVRTPNQFVDQGYQNFGQQQQQQPRVMSPNLQQLNAPRMVQQTQNNVVVGNKTIIIPISIDNNDGTRGPISKTPVVIQNDLRSPPIQSKSFRILQKITDTIDDGSTDDNANQQRNKQDNYMDAEPQLQRPTFARQMSAQQARNSPTVEQMRRMQIGHDQDNSQQYIPPSEQQVPEPKKYTGSAIPSRSFKILQAMTQPENAGPGQSDL